MSFFSKKNDFEVGDPVRNETLINQCLCLFNAGNRILFILDIHRQRLFVFVQQLVINQHILSSMNHTQRILSLSPANTMNYSNQVSSFLTLVKTVHLHFSCCVKHDLLCFRQNLLHQVVS